jgi:hypothetical protein
MMIKPQAAPSSKAYECYARRLIFLYAALHHIGFQARLSIR